MRKLILMGADPNMKTRVNKWTPLHLASMNNHLLVVRYLLESGADVSLTDKGKKSRLLL